MLLSINTCAQRGKFSAKDLLNFSRIVPYQYFATDSVFVLSIFVLVFRRNVTFSYYQRTWSLPMHTPGNQRSTLLGLIAILFWSTTIAFSRSLTEQLGTLTSAAIIYTCAGLAGIIYTAFQPGRLRLMGKLPRLYVFGCGGLFVLYLLSLYLAVGMASNRTQVLAVGLINYLWPGLSLVFSIPILGNHWKPLLPVGLAIAFGGVWLATSSMNGLSLAQLTQDRSGLAPYAWAFTAAVCWGLYSNLSRRWAGEKDGGAVPLFLLVSGLTLGLLRLFVVESSTWSLQTGLELAYMALFPGMLAYVFWDIAVRNGEIILVASISYITPLLSTLISAMVLQITPGPWIWLGAGLVFVGAMLCKVSIQEAL
jgi:drug/metabolite transporter (DMT)-like permease